ncbi:hypothetical protein O181_007879 [Austropuccinia psidii MF-1]|uniref:Uncharacterized protein n=1 Tax=Austropuccinia psidii MF-1 TaxID=1389203 RepID=A0A9Q3BLQ4_9BASI|nr:hypothetical protein [Austropuccinia psidii MF-1]
MTSNWTTTINALTGYGPLSPLYFLSSHLLVKIPLLLFSFSFRFCLSTLYLDHLFFFLSFLPAILLLADNCMNQNPTRRSTRSQTKLLEETLKNMSEAKNLPELTRDVDMVIDKGISMLKQEHILRGDGSNFQMWERRLRLIFDSYLQDPLYLQSGYVGDEKHERFCRAILLSSVPDSIQDSIITIRPCHAIYTWLKHHYFATTRSSQCVAFNKLLSIELQDDEAPSSLVMRMNEALTGFKNRSGNLGDDYVMGLLLQRAIIKRPTIYRAVMDRLDTEVSCGKATTFASCVLTLESCFQRPEVTDMHPSFNSITMMAPDISPAKEEHAALKATMQLICHNCNKHGHMARNCPNLLGHRPNTVAPTNNAFKPIVAPPQYHAHYPIITPPVQFPFNSLHQPYLPKAPSQPDLYRPRYAQRPIAGVKARMVEIGNPNEPEVGISVEDVANPGDRQSVYDTGASHSLTGDLSALCRFRTLTKPIPLCVATNTAQRSFVTGVGSLIYPGCNGALLSTGARLQMIGSDVLISTEAEGPLLRATYCGNGRKWQLPLFSRLLARAIDSDHIKHTRVDGNIPKESISTIELPCAPISVMRARPKRDSHEVEHNADKLDHKKELLQWHCLFGHIGLRRIRKLLGDAAPNYLKSSTHEIHDCEHCLLAKSLRHSPLKSNPRSVDPLDIVVADLMGPFDIPTINGGRYALNIRDVASTYGECHIICNKSDTTTRLQEVILRWQRSTGKLVKVLRTDNGGEFNNQVLLKWLLLAGIKHEHSLPFFHQQNGIAERYNRTVADMGRTILLGSGLPKSFWGHAFMWAAYTNNMIPNLHTGSKVPSEILFGIKPNLDRLRTFGELAFVHVPHERRQKLSDRAVKANVVMHLPDSKGWVFYDSVAGKFLSSAWATFPNSASITKYLTRQPRAVTGKNDINFLLNSLTLGDFQYEELVKCQDELADKVCMPVAGHSASAPKTYKQAMTSPDKEQWLQAINRELSNMGTHGVFEVLPLPKDTRPIGGGWVFVRKQGNSAEPPRFKARYVARGNSQLSGHDFHETFAPTATFTSLRILLTIAAQSEMYVATFDFVAAYLNASIEEEIWIRPPEGLEIPAGSGCRLRKALYGTRQAGRCWWTHLRASLEKRGFQMSNYDSSVYWNSDHGMIIWLHVDDGIVFSKNKADLDNLKRSLCDEFAIKWDTTLSQIIGINIARDNEGFELNQTHLIRSIVSRYWDNRSLAAVPLPSKLNLRSLTENDHVIRQSDFLSCVGALSYVATGTRPDISFAVNLLARHSKRPGKEQWSCLQHLLGYLERTSSRTLCIKPRRSKLDLEVYSDASWGGEFSRSTHGYLTRLSDCSVSWCSKRLVTVASSSCHAEFMALGIAARHSQWVQNLIDELLGHRLTIGMKCDNASCMKITMDCSSNKRTRHSDREFFISNQLLHKGLATLDWVCSAEMLADIFTKPLGPQIHQYFTDRLLTT